MRVTPAGAAQNENARDGRAARKVFAVGRGQYENIGDVILRRHLLDWIRPGNELHVYVGNSPAGYDEGLQLHPNDRVYRSFGKWYRAAMAAAVDGNAAYAFKPGEIQLTLIGMKEHLAMLPLLIALRLRGGRAIRAGVGTRNYAPLPRALMRPSIALSDITLWRDIGTATYMTTGSVMPDLAFGEGADEAAVAAFRHPSPERDVLAVSMRDDFVDLPYPSAAWLDAVRTFAERHGLRIWAVSQVRVDNERTLRLADDLGAQALVWDETTGHDQQERALRELYARSEMVISDRLHVVIAAFTEGAVPVGSPVGGTDKVDRHFRTIGIDGISIDAAGDSVAELLDRLTALAGRRAEMFDCLLDARARLRRHHDDIRTVLGDAPQAAGAVTAEAVAGR